MSETKISILFNNIQSNFWEHLFNLIHFKYENIKTSNEVTTCSNDLEFGIEIRDIIINILKINCLKILFTNEWKISSMIIIPVSQ